ncbi:hypothetical protein [Sphingomonas faeni]|uniref:hypothetical protein n=1 Tax=Sphingomonas faeni TaxID=185950 RepID=UPI0020C11D5F|nr:hypothetical protein [Sphingomonas faeni]MCK8456121.1 hypothetical protein [Sphingomonas faeni]
MADSSVNDTVKDLKTTANEVGTEVSKTIDNKMGDNGTSDLSAKTADAKQAIKEGASKYSAQAADKARTFAEDGKARASGALEQIAQLLNDAAGQVDEKLGSQYGGYARSAADSVSGFADQVKAKDIDELVDDARELVRKSPAIAVGAASAIGFVIARLVQSGVDANPKA